MTCKKGSRLRSCIQVACVQQHCLRLWCWHGNDPYSQVQQMHVGHTPLIAESLVALRKFADFLFDSLTESAWLTEWLTVQLASIGVIPCLQAGLLRCTATSTSWFAPHVELWSSWPLPCSESSEPRKPFHALSVTAQQFAAVSCYMTMLKVTFYKLPAKLCKCLDEVHLMQSVMLYGDVKGDCCAVIL